LQKKDRGERPRLVPPGQNCLKVQKKRPQPTNIPEREQEALKARPRGTRVELAKTGVFSVKTGR